MKGLDLGKYVENEQQQEACEHTREVASKYGIQVVCNEEEAEQAQIVIHQSEWNECEDGKTVVSKYGVQIICDEAKK